MKIENLERAQTLAQALTSLRATISRIESKNLNKVHFDFGGINADLHFSDDDTLEMLFKAIRDHLVMERDSIEREIEEL